jgi:hypothetical protein
MFAASLAIADERLPVLRVGGDVYSNVTVTSVTATDIYFTHSRGMGNAKLRNLDSALQKHFGYSAAREAAVKRSLDAPAPTASTQAMDTGAIDLSNPKAAMATAMDRVRTIVNQPVAKLPMTPDMEVFVLDPVWFHPGAIKPDFNTVDIRATQEFPYKNHEYISCVLSPGVCFRGQDIEFNSMTKYFYTDRSLPKKILTEPEMLEINALYRVIGQCERKLNPLSLPDEWTADSTGSFLSLHRSVIVGAAAGLIVLLVTVRAICKRQPAS